MDDYAQIDLNEYEFVKVIGQDERFINYEVVEKKTNQICFGKILKESEENISKAKKFFRELELSKTLNSPFILKCKGFGISNFHENRSIAGIFEYASNGTLKEIIRKENCSSVPSEYTNTKKMMIIYGIASGMAYLHSKGIIHRNLKPENIYLDDYLLPKITNFYDLSFTDENEDLTAGHSMTVGTPLYFAPEVINDEDYDKSIDVYSFSMVLHEIILGELPRMRIIDVMNGKKVPISNNIPKNFRNLIERCLHYDPKERPSFNEILSLLKTDEFISDEFDFDKDEFLDFIESIENQGNEPKYEFDKVHIDYPDLKKLDVDFEQKKLKNYDKLNKIGNGQYGIVYKIKEKSTGNIYAAKTNIMLLQDCELISIYSLSREINILSQLNYPSIIKFIGYSQNDFKNDQKPTIITEFIENSTLESIIKLQDNGLTPSEWNATKVLINVYGIASGMAYLHSKDFLHRDLKPANIFLDEHLFPKIGDFGLAKEVDDNSPLEYNLNVGTPAFMAPEIFDSFIYCKAGDVYAFAMLLYYLITCEHPFDGYSAFQIYRFVIEGIRPKFYHDIPNCYKKLIEKCWLQDFNKRPTFDEIVDILEKDKEFITEEIDEDEYLNYIDYINNNKVKKSFDNIIIDFEELRRKQLTDLSLNISNLDLTEFTKQRFLRRIENFEIYEIKNNETNNIYEAKISTNSIIDLTRNETIHLQREVNILSKLNHPSFLKFIGFSLMDFKKQPMPVIVTEIPPNKSLRQLLIMEKNHEHVKDWDDTKKLITIFGIASGMAYLHSNKVIHRNLNPESIFFDEYLLPKIGNFGLLTQIHSINTMTHQTSIGIKGNFIYSSPELLESNEYSQSSDVYAFSLIVYEIMTNKTPFENLNNFKKLFKEVVTKENRPQFNADIDSHYRKLIELCWSQKPDDRPTFEEIVSILKDDQGFITKKVNKKAFIQYVQLIKKSKIEFYSKNRVVKFDDIINKKSSAQKSNATSNLHENDDDDDVYNDDEAKVKLMSNLRNSISLKNWIGSVKSDFINSLFNESQPIYSTLTTSNFKVKIGESMNDSDFVLLKLIKKKFYVKGLEENEIDHKKIQEFIKIYKTINDMNHPNIIKSLGYFEGDKNQAPSIIYEFYSKRLIDVIKSIEEYYLITIIYEIAHAMKIAHSKHLIHRNLNIDNIFIDNENHVKIDEFGLPALIDQKDQIDAVNETLFCLSQELLLNKDYNEKVDVFAFGMIMQFILRRGKRPYLSYDDIMSGKKAKIPISLNKLAFSIVSRCLSHSQDERPSFRAITQTIKKYDFKLIDGIEVKNHLIKDQLKSIIKQK